MILKNIFSILTYIAPFFLVKIYMGLKYACLFLVALFITRFIYSFYLLKDIKNTGRLLDYLEARYSRKYNHGE
jgi:ABC-type transport system involved in Fe-S cluster assembly fused permease/ATPase subunit